MYFGSKDICTENVLVYEKNIPKIKEVSWIPAIATMWREIFDNALDEVVGHGFGNKIDITYDESKLLFSVEDNGRGIPIDFDKTYKMHKATLALSQIMAGRNFDERGQTAGVNGIGASGVNFCSEYFTVDIWRDKQYFHQEFKESMFGATELTILKPKIKPYAGTETGTKIEFKLSSEIFENMTLPFEFVYSRVYEIALTNPKIKFTFNGQKINTKPKWETSLFENSIVIDIKEDSFSSKFILVPNFLQGEHYHTLVNNIFVLNGGVHIDQFKKYFFSGILENLERESKKRSLNLSIGDITQNFLIFNVTKMNAPNFDSQSKTRLINDEIKKIFKNYFSNNDSFKSIINSNKEWIDSIYERCKERTQAKEKKDVESLGKKNKKIKVAELEDACGRDRTKCILFATEGLSSVAGISAARNPEIHGALPLRGKPLNVREEIASVVLKNEVWAKVMGTVGLVPGERVNRRLLRYGKIYITTDADEDGKNIAALIINFFYTFWKELFDSSLPPFIYVFETPLIIAVKGKVRKFWYDDNVDTFNGDDYKGWEITRAKGLAALKKDDWKQILENPKLIPIIDDGNLDESLDLLFAKKLSDKRKEWIGI
jgi:DNA gyrase/topoisomerase IV subunit B